MRQFNLYRNKHKHRQSPPSISRVQLHAGKHSAVYRRLSSFRRLCRVPSTRALAILMLLSAPPPTHTNAARHEHHHSPAPACASSRAPTANTTQASCTSSVACSFSPNKPCVQGCIVARGLRFATAAFSSPRPATSLGHVPSAQAAAKPSHHSHAHHAQHADATPHAASFLLVYNRSFSSPPTLPPLPPRSSMSTYLRVVGGLAGLVLRDLVDSVLLALLALAKGLALLGDAHHLSLF